MILFDETLRQRILENIEPERRGHVLGVEEAAAALARRWGEDENRARLAALLHDITKGWEKARHLQFAQQYNIIFRKPETDNPKLLHGVTGAVVARSVYGADSDIVEAVRWHTTGRPGMSVLEKIVYLADKIEPTRDYPEVTSFRELAYENIDAAVLAVMSNGLARLEREGRFIHPDTLKARDYYCGR